MATTTMDALEVLGVNRAPVALGKPRRRVGRVYLVLPAYNEEETLPNLLRRVSEMAYTPDGGLTVCVIDDGSTDRTAEVAKRDVPGLDVRLVSHPVNQGLGGALQTGIKTAVSLSDSDDDVVVVMDADDTHDVGLIEYMVKQICDGADVSIASRFTRGGDDSTAPAFRRMLSRGASVVFRTALPLAGVRDFTSGYRAYTIGLLREASQHYGDRLIEESGFACMVELLLKLRHWDAELDEVAMHLRYDRKLSASKLRLFRTIGQYFKLALRSAVSPPPRKYVHA